MLDAYIIEELRRREEEERSKEDRPVMELPVYDGKESYRPARKDEEKEKNDRGVIVIDF